VHASDLRPECVTPPPAPPATAAAARVPPPPVPSRPSRASS
jgi:hypothetical protein